jgi:hypothetical protein
VERQDQRRRDFASTSVEIDAGSPKRVALFDTHPFAELGLHVVFPQHVRVYVV